MKILMPVMSNVLIAGKTLIGGGIEVNQDIPAIDT
jgi:hypothetical protein